MIRLMRNYNKIKKQLQALKQENVYLKDDNELLQNLNNSTFDAQMKREKENENLEELTKLATSLNIIMTQMLVKCDEETLVGSAYKSAILQFQRELANGLGVTSRRNNENQTNGLWAS